MIELLRILPNEEDATEIVGDTLRSHLQKKGVFLINLSSAPGAGKTALIQTLLESLPGECLVLLADQNSFEQSYKVSKDADVLQLRLDPDAFIDAGHLLQIDLTDPRIKPYWLLENNDVLDYFSSVDTGAHLEIYVQAPSEGDDKPLRNPAPFQRADLVLVNKADRMHEYNFDFDRYCRRIHRLNPEAEVMAVSALRKENIDGLTGWISRTKEARFK